jgi:hypothetical protein
MRVGTLFSYLFDNYDVLALILAKYVACSCNRIKFSFKKIEILLTEFSSLLIWVCIFKKKKPTELLRF